MVETLKKGGPALMSVAWLVGYLHVYLARNS